MVSLVLETSTYKQLHIRLANLLSNATKKFCVFGRAS